MARISTKLVQTVSGIVNGSKNKMLRTAIRKETTNCIFIKIPLLFTNEKQNGTKSENTLMILNDHHTNTTTTMGNRQRATDATRQPQLKNHHGDGGQGAK